MASTDVHHTDHGHHATHAAHVDQAILSYRNFGTMSELGGGAHWALM